MKFTEPIVEERGWFARTFCRREFSQIGFEKEFVQINHSYNKDQGTLRGFHYQMAPKLEAKLIRCVGGRVLDYAVDLREGSDTFLQNVSVELSAENQKMILIPEGVAHGFISLSDHSALIYHHTEFYSKEWERGIRYDDPLLNIKLPVPVKAISERDKTHEFLPRSFSGVLVK